jgi:hypothetical protein
MNASGYEVSFWGDGNVPKLDGVMIVQLCDCIKTI